MDMRSELLLAIEGVRWGFVRTPASAADMLISRTLVAPHPFRRQRTVNILRTLMPEILTRFPPQMSHRCIGSLRE
jgi:hypothetical protein